jgi:molecular chaperone DnaK
MPAMQEMVKKFFGKDPHMGVNPDEVVAVGAAIQGGILAGDVKDVLLLDVIPLSLGIETMGGVSTKLIEKNTTVPTAKSQVFSTAADNQTSVEIHIVQGERPMAHDNKSLGKFILDGIPPSPRGMPQIEVSFDVDANGILNVTAKDKATGKANSIKITASSGLSKEEVEKMKKEAEMNSASDNAKKDLVEAKNIAEQLIYTSEKALKDAGDKVPVDTKKPIEEKIASLKTAKDSTDIATIKSATEALSNEIQKIGQYMNQNNSTNQNTNSNPNPDNGNQNGNDGNVRDAEFKEKK